MDEMLESQLQSLMAAIERAETVADLREAELKALGRKGLLPAEMAKLGSLAPDARVERAKLLNRHKADMADVVATRLATLEKAALTARLAAERIDMSLPADSAPQGSVHPISQVMDELAEIFADLGLFVATGPEIEDDWHNFTALNIPPEHPARAMHDTFYARLAGGEQPEPAGDEQPEPAGDQQSEPAGDRQRYVLRTHTSPVQIRTMMAQKPPIRIIAPGRVYRSDSDATHTPMFHQVEGLVIDRGIHMGHLKWTLETFVKAFFEVDDVILRLRPSFFPFTEPSVEVDVGCSWEGGTLKVGGSNPVVGSSASSGSWLEILGAGMVHPRVIANCGLDPDEWQGFAFGCGIDRLAMLKYGMTDLRAFFDADLRWLKHYGFASLDVPTLSGGLSQ